MQGFERSVICYIFEMEESEEWEVGNLYGMREKRWIYGVWIILIID